ncbi:MAG: Wzz/FepE/Etk N-terminal domain-containing protein, partial [Salinisphaera sp.]|nr:Wzz/FepE/Etk N-terminal domain-containing protein [Salinisphaera sp.]MDN5939099.1 Wzz/FepE/Etk N-terminal domain-containing protein [Salinisphaera sp.]
MGVYPGGDSHPPEAASRTSSSPVGRSGPPSDDEIDLARLVHLLITGKWWIAGCALIALVGAAIYLFAAQPVYRVEALVQIQPEGSSALQEVLQFNPIGGPTAAQAPAQAEIYIIESHDVLGEVVRKLGLDVHAAPDYFPLIGESIARLGVAGKPAQKPVPPEQGSWWSHYAWQPVDIDVRRFILPPALYDETFTLRALGAGQYLLMDEHGNSVLHGQVGTVASGKSADGGQIRLFVASLDASEPPTDFTLSRSPWLSGVDALKRRLEVGLKGETTGVISISVEGEDAQKITAIVNAVAQAYLRQNVEMHSKQAQQSLAFLKKQLPKLRDELEAAENKLAGYRKKHQAVGLDAEAQALLGQVVNIEKQRGQLELELARLRQLYTSEHPKLQAIHSQLQSLAETRKKLEVQIGKLPASQKSILRLRRNVEVNTQLYTALLNRAQELRVVKAGTVGNARIIDEAYVPGLPVPSRASLVLLAALLLGAGVGFALVSLRAALRHTLEDPKRIENELGLPVYAVVPYSGWLARRSRQADRNAQREAPIPARDHPDEATVEALRSLRTSLFFAQMESGSNALL